MRVHLPGIKTFIFGRYGSLLLVLSALLVFSPFVETLIGRYLMEILFVAALLSGLRALDIKTQFYRFMIVLLVLSLGCGYLGTMQGNQVLFGIGTAGEALFLSLVALTILGDLFHGKQVSGDTLAGAVCVYLLIPVIFSYLYLLTELGMPESFSFTQGETARMQMWVSKEFFPFFYFSLITMTTVGYGDMLPVTSVARTLASVEAIIGQIYLTILVARLVGMYMRNQQEKDE